MFSILNSAYRPQKIIPNQINTTAVILENEKTPGDEVAFKFSAFLLACLAGVFERGGKGAFGREREARGTRPSDFSRARNSLSLPFQTPATHDFLSVEGSAFGRCRFLSAIYFLVPYALQSGGRKLALGKLLLCSVGLYVKVSTKKRFSGLMSDLKFCQVEVAAVCWRIAIVISSTAPCFRVHKRVSFKLAGL